MFNPVIVLLAVAVGLLLIGHKILSPVLCWVGFLELVLGISMFIHIVYKYFVIVPKKAI